MIRDDTIGSFLLVCGQVIANKPARCFFKMILFYLKEKWAYIFGTTWGWVMNDRLFHVLISKTTQIQVPVLMAQLGWIWLGSGLMRLSRWSGHAEIVLLCELYLHLVPALPKWAQISLPVCDMPRDWRSVRMLGNLCPPPSSSPHQKLEHCKNLHCHELRLQLMIHRAFSLSLLLNLSKFKSSVIRSSSKM